MNKIATIAWKDAIMRFSSRSELLFFLILPVVFTFLLGGGSILNIPTAVPVLVVDEDGSELSQTLLTNLAETGTVEIDMASADQATRQFERDEAAAILTIPAGFEADLLAGKSAAAEITKQPNDQDADAVEQAIASAASTVGRALTAAAISVEAAEERTPFDSESDRVAYFSEGLALAQDELDKQPDRYRVTVLETELEKETSYDNAAHQSAGQLVTWVLIPLLGTAGFLAFERTRGTLQRLVATPTSGSSYLLGTISGQLGLAIIQMFLLIVFGVFVMKVDWGQSVPGLAVMLVTFGLASVALGVMLGTFVKTESQASNIAIMLGMSMALLGGCWWPLELFPPAMQTIVKVLPTTWAMQGLSDLVLRGQGLIDILPEAIVLLGFALVFFVVGVRRFRYE